MNIEAIVFIIIAAFISFLMKRFGQEDNGDSRKQAGQKNPAPQSQKAEMQSELLKEPRVTSRNSPEQLREARPSAASKTKASSVIDTWTGEDLVQGIVLSEILGPPKSKRKK